MYLMDLILPAYNPLPGWEDVVITRFLSLEKQLPEIQIQLIIVNDGSSTIDEVKSVDILKQNIVRFHWISYSQNKGKGYALRKGAEASISDFIIYTDIDWPYTEMSMVGLMEKLTRNTDAVIGTRDTGYYIHLPPARKIISRLLRKINASLLKLKVEDTQAGLKGFRAQVKNIFLQTTINRYLFDLEFIYLLSKKDVKVESYPITLRPGITFSKMNRKILFHEARNFLKIWAKQNFIS